MHNIFIDFTGYGSMQVGFARPKLKAGHKKCETLELVSSYRSYAELIKPLQER